MTNIVAILIVIQILLVLTITNAKPSKKYVGSNGTCVDAIPKNLNFESGTKEITLNGSPFYLKGASWFGFETQNYVVHGLWAVSYSSLLDFLADNDFNFIRLPYSVDLINGNYTPDSINPNVNPEIASMTSMEAMDFIISEAGNRGLLILLDMHSLEPGNYMQNTLWYDDSHPESLVSDTWVSLIKRYQNQWNVFAADIFNEPSGATWGDGSATDFAKWSKTMGQTLLDTGSTLAGGPQWLNYVEGIANGCETACFWGENLEGVANSPVIYSNPSKVIYSPHVYGPSVAYQDYFVASNFPDNMPDIWDAHWGYIDNGICIGEWGGLMSGNDEIWMDAFVSYLISINQTNQAFWCLNPDSGDTGGLLEYDWTTPVTSKIDLLQKLMPNPSKLTYDQSTKQVCYS